MNGGRCRVVTAHYLIQASGQGAMFGRQSMQACGVKLMSMQLLMSRFRVCCRTLAAAALMIACGWPAWAARAATRPVLLELFTSQSCSSCPPADAYLGELAQRGDVLPLSFHVDYWNGLGWRDRLSSQQFTERQRAYAVALRGNVYTPQLVIDGRYDAVGSDRPAVERAISDSKQSPQTVELVIERQGANLTARFASPQSVPESAQLLLLTFDPLVTQAIGGGENSGRTVGYHNVVRSMRVLDQRPVATISTSLQPNESGASIALIVQTPDGIVGVAATH